MEIYKIYFFLLWKKKEIKFNKTFKTDKKKRKKLKKK